MGKTCIYCRLTKPEREFNREHVVPEAFGKFKNGLVLHGCVCRSCNDYFGQRLDRTLARSSLEGLERYQWGIKPPSDVKHFTYHDVRLTAAAAGDFEDCLLELTPDPHVPGGIKLVPAQQVGFTLTRGSGFKYYSLPDFLKGMWCEDPEISPRDGVRIIGTDAEPVMKVLAECGVQFEKWRTMNPASNEVPKAVPLVRYTHAHLRAIAKIAFNYLAYVHGAEYALQEEFDSTRRYIRFGKEPFLPAVHVTEQEIFRPGAGKRPDERAVAHILTVTRPLNADVVLGQVTLFNWIRYNVILCYTVPSNLIESGHIFSPRSMTVSALGKKRQTDLRDRS